MDEKFYIDVPTAVSTQFLMKDGIAITLEKTFISMGYSPQTKLKTLLECLKLFTMSSTFFYSN